MIATIIAPPSSAFTNGGRFQILGAILPGGQPDDVTPIEEKLTTPGVDGARWRAVHQQYPQFQITGLLAASNRDNANSWADSFRVLAGELVTLQINYGSGDVVYTRVKVMTDPRPQATPHSAPMIYGPTNTQYSAHVNVQITMQLTEAP